MEIVRTIRFDEVDYDIGYEYRGFHYEVKSKESLFLVRIYDDDREHAIIVRPTSKPENEALKELVALFRTEFKISRVSLYKGDSGSYAQIDLETLSFFPS